VSKKRLKRTMPALRFLFVDQRVRLKSMALRSEIDHGVCGLIRPHGRTDLGWVSLSHPPHDRVQRVLTHGRLALSLWLSDNREFPAMQDWGTIEMMGTNGPGCRRV
jgi:hypothetical protein